MLLPLPPHCLVWRAPHRLAQTLHWQQPLLYQAGDHISSPGECTLNMGRSVIILSQVACKCIVQQVVCVVKVLLFISSYLVLWMCPHNYLVTSSSSSSSHSFMSVCSSGHSRGIVTNSGVATSIQRTHHLTISSKNWIHAMLIQICVNILNILWRSEHQIVYALMLYDRHQHAAATVVLSFLKW